MPGRRARRSAAAATRGQPRRPATGLHPHRGNDPRRGDGERYAAALAAGLLASVLSHDLGTFMIGIALAGMGQGAYISVDVATMTEVLPETAEAGKDLGVVALAYQLPQLLVPVISVPLLAIGGAGPNYHAVFTGSVAAVLGGLAVLPIRKVK